MASASSGSFGTDATLRLGTAVDQPRRGSSALEYDDERDDTRESVAANGFAEKTARLGSEYHWEGFVCGREQDEESVDSHCIARCTIPP
jgi:hypothetical protein